MSKPYTHKRWTIILGTGESELAHDVVVENTYESDIFMERMIDQLGDAEAYGEVFTPELPFSSTELGLIADALDSHVYWQLSDEDRRDSGYVQEPYTDEERECVEFEERVREMAVERERVERVRDDR